MSQNVLLKTEFQFPGQKSLYKGKVRDVYNINDRYLVMVASDRISAFDVVLPRGIPFKGQVLNQIAAKFLDATADICPNWKIATPDPNVTIGRFCKIYPVEMIIRGYLTGSSWRTYQKGARAICGVPVPDGMKEHQRFPEPIITPTTKAAEGHDEDITEEEILATGLIPADEYALIKRYTYELFRRGTEIAARQGLILVDTKYEFGKGEDGRIYLCDEIHTPDSSRYFYLEGYEARQERGEPQRQLSKEFVREWLMANGFMGREGQEVPAMSDDWIREISDRYIELFEGITGEKFTRSETSHLSTRVETNIREWLRSHHEPA
ncbi:MAG TPA: phosphoribosylaminoimidazolesuccinocarboxamide synthase [Bacteroidales bacterium]|nr:phosphoribosylaminoimidazolesuccinocarboxamide synthase [Bacteroidales bacterium]